MRVCQQNTLKVFSMAAVLALACTGFGGMAWGQGHTGGISGRVFLDENADAYFEECECDCELANVPIRLYRDRCAGLIVQTVKTDKDGYFHFTALEPGDYCVMPQVKMICEGFQPTTPITRRVRVEPGEVTEAEWFGFDHFFDTND